MDRVPAPWSGRPVAIVHDWFQGYHGSERVVEALADDVLAEASRVDILTFSAARELLPPSLAARIVRESRLSRLPGLRQVGHDPGRWRYLLPYMPHYFRSLDLGGYALVVVSSHACAINAAPPPGTPCVCYSHTPIRYVWLADTERGRLSGARGVALRLAAGWLRSRDRAAAQRPDRLVANSSAVAERIRRFYGRDAAVVHPPVELSDLRPAAEAERQRFLWVGRLTPYKRPLQVAEAFRGLSQRLTMVGIGPQEAELRQSLPENVELRGWISREELASLYGEAVGFIHIGEEDFGITMVEALAAGTPVIALNAGGARDIVRDGRDGALLADPSPASLAAAVERVAAETWDRDALASRAEEFSRERFAARMRELLVATMSAGRPDS
ncbi:MAG TPA: glycosyltransferase [Solirubrobacterales bacterium]|jgi:glycosyltransferase involved in cell wall biosynthesis